MARRAKAVMSDHDIEELSMEDQVRKRIRQCSTICQGSNGLDSLDGVYCDDNSTVEVIDHRVEAGSFRDTLRRSCFVTLRSQKRLPFRRIDQSSVISTAVSS